MKYRIWNLSGWLLAGFCLLLSGGTGRALQINRTSDAVIYIDTANNVYCSYAAYQIVNNDGVAYSNLWVKADTFSGTIVSLGGGDPGQYNTGSLAVGKTNTVFFYYRTTGVTAVAQTHAIKIFRGRPDVGTVLLTNTFSLTVVSSSQNNSAKIDGATVAPNPPPLGGLFAIKLTGHSGVIGGANTVNFTPAVYTNWDAASYQLVSCSIIAAGGNSGTFSNTLFVAFGSQSDTLFTNTYWFRAVAVAPSNTVSPLFTQSGGGGNYNHAPAPTAGTVQPVLSATNTTLVSALANVSQLYTNEVVTFTVRFTNSSVDAVSLDSAVDTLPPGFSYVTNSSSFNGVAMANPVVVGQTATWSERYDVPGGSSRDLTFQATPVTSGFATNAVIAYSQSTVIDSTIVTTDNVPARVSVRVLLPPSATNDTNTTLEDTILNVSAPGVLANDSEPNGFTISVASYTQPAHGSVTVNTTGSYIYQPTTNYNGSDSFTYTLTNGNARAATATVNLTITAVNDAPGFTKGADQTVLEDAGSQTVASWATAISAGPSDEAGQTVTFIVSNNNSNLFLVPPSVSTGGALTYTPATNANGSATVTIYAQDNGGTANGGSNTSASQTFVINVTAVNDAPGFTKGADQTVLEDAGSQTVASWATAISAGPSDEAGQTVTFIVSNNNSNLFLVPPSVSTGGALTYTPATNANGSATVTIYAQDNGGTANGGSNTSASQTFVINVTAVNDAPTLNAISNLILQEGAGSQTVNLSGITVGPTNEAGQSLAVTTTSSNPALIPNPTVIYTSPNATGSLNFTSLSNVLGTTTITVVVRDNGGTANGGVDSMTNTFTVTVQSITNVWNSGGQLAVNLTNATGTAGAGYTQTNYTGFLQITATNGNPFTLKLISIAGSSPGNAANFNNNSNYTWVIASFTQTLLGFDAAKIVVDSSSFSNDLAGGTFSVTTNANFVNLVFVPNHAPSAFPLFLNRAWGTVMRIPISYVLTNFTSDADGDLTRLTNLGSSTNGTPITTNASYIFFTPTNNISESFTYTVRDFRTYRPGDTVRTASGLITISVTNATSSAVSAAAVGGVVTINFAGVPGYAYDVERTTNLVNWSVILTTNAPAHGLWIFRDGTPPQPSAYYRLRQH